MNLPLPTDLQMIESSVKNEPLHEGLGGDGGLRRGVLRFGATAPRPYWVFLIWNPYFQKEQNKYPF